MMIAMCVCLGEIFSSCFTNELLPSMQDLIDLRKDAWRPRRDVAGPKTIDQIHKEVAREAKAQQLQVNKLDDN